MSSTGPGPTGRVPLTRHHSTRQLAPLVPLALVVGISPLATDMYIPGLPELAADLRTSPALAQLTLTAFLVSFAVGMLLIGPLSDAVGRRRLVLLGSILFTLASVLCALSPSLPVLVGARFLQGLGSACVMSLMAAMVRHTYPHRLLGRAIGWTALTVALSSAAGPPR